MDILYHKTVYTGLDLDRTERPPHSTPYGHSVMMVAIWNLLGLGMVLAFRPYIDPLDLGLGISVGLWGHLLLDVLTGVPVYTIPRSTSLPAAVRIAPAGPNFERLHDGGVAIAASWEIYQKVSDGELAWPYWGRLILAR